MNLISDPSSSVLESGVVPGAPITAVAYAQHPGQFALFFTDPHGEVYTILENATTGWGPWSSVSQGSTTPGAPITAVAYAQQPGRFALFVADRNGGVYTNSGSAATGWDGWSSVLLPGRIFKKVIPLDLLQRKFDLFFNQRSRPLFKIKLDGTDYGKGALTVFFDDPVAEGGYKIVGTREFRRDELDIDIPVPFDHHFYFRDLNSNGLTLNLIPEQPVSIEVGLPFETGGPAEIDINHWSDVDLTRFSITIKFQLESNSGKVGLVTSKEWINTDVSIDSIPGYQGVVEGKIKSTVNQKVYEVLHDNSGDLNQPLTRWLVGGDFYVAGVASDNQALTIDYIIPLGQLEPFPEHPQPPLEPGPLANIDHIVVLMMENRSFDHMLGYLSKEGGRTDIKGLHGDEKNSYNGRDYPSFLLPGTRFDHSPDHSYDPVKDQINNGNMDGFVKSFVKKYPDIDDPGQIMGYHNAAHVSVYNALASQFLICQHWFAAHPGPTFCNRFYTLTGRLNRRLNPDGSVEFETDNPAGNDLKPVFTKTLFDHLTEHGISWHYYEHRYCFLRFFERYTFDTNHIVDALDPVQGFCASAKAGTLPAVSFIDPNFIDEPDGQDNDDGAPADIAAGQNLVGRVVDAVVQGPKWQKTLLIITYDEHGGFFDHVNPLEFSSDKTSVPVSGIDHYGVRVPAFVISPWVDPGKVSDVVFDHTSIAKTIAKRFMSANPPDMGERMAAANDLSMVLRSTARQDRPNIPVPPAPASNAALARQAAPVAESDDFKEVLRAMRSRYPVRR